MAYKLTLQDLEEVNKSSPSTQGAGYTLTPEDLGAVKNDQPGGLARYVGAPLAGLQQGLINTAASVPNLFLRASDALNRGLNHILPDSMQLPMSGHRAPVPTLAPEAWKGTTGYGLGQAAGEMLPSFAVPGLGAAEAVAGRLAPNALSRLLSRAAPLADSAATGAGYGALMGANDPNSNLGTSALLGGALGGGMHAGLSAANVAANPFQNYLAKLAQKAEKSGGSATTTLRTPEQVAEAAQRLQQIDPNLRVNIFDLIGAPSKGNKLRNLNVIPGSKIFENEQKLTDKGFQYADNFLKKLKGNSTPETINQDLVDVLRNNHDTHRDAAKELYNQVNRTAKESNVKLEKMPNLKAIAKAIVNENKGGFVNNLSPELNTILGNILKSKKPELKTKLNTESTTPLNPELNTNLDLALNTEKSAKNINQEEPLLNFERAHFQRSRLGELEREAKKAYHGSVAGRLKKALENDMELAVKNSKNRNLMEQWDTANKYFSNNVVPYGKPEISNILSGRTNESGIKNVLLADKNKKLLEHLSPEEKNQVLYAHLNNKKKANELISPGAIVKGVNELTPAQQARLLTPEHRNAIANNNLLSQLTRETQISQAPPPTGVRNNDFISNLLGGAAAVGLGAANVHDPKTIAGWAAWPLAIMAARRGYSPKAIQHYINAEGTNPATRNALARLLTMGGINAAN